MEALMDASLEMTEAWLEKIEANQGKVEIKMEACLEEIQIETIGTLEDRTKDGVVSAHSKGRSYKGSTVEKTERPGTQQWTKGPRRKTVPTSEKEEDILQEFQGDRRAGYCGGVGFLRNEKRDVKGTAFGKEGNGGKPVGYSGPLALRREQYGM
jgi:hypothetical protein